MSAIVVSKIMIGNFPPSGMLIVNIIGFVVRRLPFYVSFATSMVFIRLSTIRMGTTVAHKRNI